MKVPSIVLTNVGTMVIGSAWRNIDFQIKVILASAKSVKIIGMSWKDSSVNNENVDTLAS
jgi:hypothetical protein